MRCAKDLPPSGVPLVVIHQRAGLPDRIEGGVRDEVVERPADQEALLAADLDPLGDPPPELRVEVASERVRSLVIVVVGVEDRVIELAHEVHSPLLFPCETGPPRSDPNRDRAG